MDRAEEMLREGQDPGEEWLREQHHAAAAELEPVFHNIAAKMDKEPFHVESERAQSLAFGLAVFAAIKRRRKDERTCPHSEGLTPPPLVVDLTHGVMTCRDCAPRWLELPPEDDGHCDVCDEEGLFFSEFYVQIGPALIRGHLCDTCKSFLPEPER